MFSENDLLQMQAYGISPNAVENQLERFSEGFPYLDVVSPAVLSSGIMALDEESRQRYIRRYDQYVCKAGVVKFVPASGAATRMFKDLFEFLVSGRSNKVVNEFLVENEEFAFYDRLERYLPDDPSAEEIISALVSGSGLNYGAEPKALILFHKYADEARTALEEHLTEGAQYAVCEGKVHIHFTVSPEHRKGFESLLCEVLPKYQDRFGIQYSISMSEQKRSTDTIAVNPDNTPFRNPDGSLLFRPAGHGALIENLNGIDADIIFIKNIDNVTTDSRRGDTIEYKKTLAGVLLELQEKTFGYIRHQADTGDVSGKFLDQVGSFIEDELFVALPFGVRDMEPAERWGKYLSVLDRPLRVCGMVRNEGEPGGGPFWARNDDGSLSLQIVESTQIAEENEDIMRQATHFNPVDLVCGVKDWKGRKFDLSRFVDPDTGFISDKSKDGKPLRAQELPGLWNGAMSKWNTVFVEVPVSTFTPVKVVTDLLRPQHREK